MRIIYYYQTFVGLDSIFESTEYPTHIHLSSIHFGKNEDNTNYIHLNNNPPFDPLFDDVWSDLFRAKELGIKIVLMIGGAGGGYHSFFLDYKSNLQLLIDTIIESKVISGVDLDIEEYTTIDNVKMLIRDLKSAFPDDFTISMAPIQSSLEDDLPGMSGFIYKDLYNSKEGSLIDYFNGQFYFDYTLESFEKCVNNGYPAEMIVMGMISSEDFNNTLNVISQIKKKYPKFGGVFNWEYYNSPPLGTEFPNEWCFRIRNILI
tara:strand:+ start:5828 stop:6610 length:783 start_codon:yes stop_codon:yes gene_type:complete